MAQSNRRFLVVLLLLFFIILFLVYQFAYQAKMGALADVEQQVKQKGESVALLTQTVRSKQKEIPTMKDLETELAALPIWDNTEEIILQLRAAEKNTGIILHDVKVQLNDGNRLNQYADSAAPSFPTVKEVELSLTVGGNLPQVEAFLHMVETSPRTMMVNSFSFGSDAGSGREQGNPAQDGKVLASVTVTAYYDPVNAAMVDPKWRAYPFTPAGN